MPAAPSFARSRVPPGAVPTAAPRAPLRQAAKDAVRALFRANAPLAWTAALMLAAMPATYIIGQLHPQVFNGVDAYIKPLKFQLSLALYLGTLAWFAGHLTPAAAATRSARVVTWMPIGAALFEASYILWQAARGEASHFNIGTPAGSVMYALMGVGALALVASAGTLAHVLRRGARPGLEPAYVLSVRWGLWLTFAAGGLAGAVMSQMLTHGVGPVAGDAGGLPLLGWSRVQGDLRVAHFFGIHAMQFLPLAGLWLAHRAGRAAGADPRAAHGDPAQATARRRVHAASIGYALFCAAVFVQALLAIPFPLGR